MPNLPRLNVAELPQDLESLHKLVREQQALIEAHTLEIEHLRLLIAKLRRLQFGRSSEKLDHELGEQIAQLELKLEELEAISAENPLEPQPPASTAAPTARVTTQPTRKPLPPQLPRENCVHEPPWPAGESQRCRCGGVMQVLGETVSEMLEHVPARFKVIRHVRPKYACSACESIVQAPAPARPIARGLAGPGLLAHIIVSKYQDHLPLYRQSEIYAREGVELERSTLADWVGGAAGLLAPLVDALRMHVLAGNTLHADDTPVPVLAPGTGKTKTGRLWTYVRDERGFGSEAPPAVWLTYSPDRKAKHPAEHLTRYRGILQADGYAGFQGLYDRVTHPLLEAACWAHVRRKFYDFYVATESPLARDALDRIQALYQIEEQIRGQPADDRRAERQARAGPLLTALKTWLLDTVRKLGKKSELASVIHYALVRWTALTRYCDDGHIEIDNNAAERALRAVALGRKNWLFAGSDRGAERAAAMYSLLGSAKLNGIEPAAYLSAVLSRIAEHPINRVAELLPWNLTPAKTTPQQLAA